ncbi:MAG: hypothetical protein R3C52_09145 [Hyphomonadaceae bacterium]
MSKKGFFQLRPDFLDSGVTVEVPHFDGLIDLGKALRRASAATGVQHERSGQMPGGFFVKCASPEDMGTLWSALEPILLEDGHKAALRLHALAGSAFKYDREAYLKTMEAFDGASPLDPRFDPDAPIELDSTPS